MTINSYLINNSGEFFQCSSAQIRARKTHQMATRKLFDATARYLTTTHDDSDDETKKMMKSMLMKQQHHSKQQQQQRANSKIKLEINKRFLVSTLANCAHANRYRDSNGLYRAKEKEDAVMKTPSTCKSGRQKQQQQMKTPGTKKRTRSEDQEEETNEKRRRAGGGGASTSSSSSSSSDENDDENENENDDIEDKIRKLLLLSKTKRGRGLIGARMDDVVKEDFIENENARGSTRKKSCAKKKKEKRRRKKEKKREKKEKKEKRKGERGKLRGVENSS